MRTECCIYKSGKQYSCFNGDEQQAERSEGVEWICPKRMKGRNVRHATITATVGEILDLVEGIRRRLLALSGIGRRQTEEDETLIPPVLVENADSGGCVKMHVYWLGSAGLAKLSADLPGSPPVARIGCSVEPDIGHRLCSASSDGYGSWSRDVAGFREELGFRSWVMQAILTTRVSSDSSIVPKTRTIEVLLPRDMSRRRFDRALHLALASWSLSDRYPERTRYTLYSMGADRMSRAREIYVGLDPRHDGDRLLTLVEGILEAHRHREKAHEPRSPTPPQLPFAPPLRTQNTPASARTRQRMSPAQIKAMQTRLRYEGGRKAR